MRLSLTYLASTAAVLSLLLPAKAMAACAEPDFVPFSGDVKIVCAIDWQEAGENDSALIVPLGNDLWSAWVHSGTYTLRSIEMLATTNSCNGLSLVGRVDDYVYRIFIEAETSTILVNLARDDPRLNDQGHGDCRLLNEEEYAIDLRENLMDELEQSGLELN